METSVETVTLTLTELRKTIWHIAATVWIGMIIGRLPELITVVCSAACKYIHATH